MSVDIERTVIYDETVEEIPGEHNFVPGKGIERVCTECGHGKYASEYFGWPCKPFVPKTHTVITAGDDGFIEIVETAYGDQGTMRVTKLGLTPSMISAIGTNWAIGRVQP